jgi:hypothetical protein
MLKFWLVTALTLATPACFADYSRKDVLKVRNDKEVMISAFNKRDRDRIVEKYHDKALRDQITNIFYDTLLNFLNARDNQCELRFIDVLTNELNRQGIASNEKSITDHLMMIRVYNGIDDIFFKILKDNVRDFYGLKNLNLKKTPSKLILKHEKLLANNDIKDLYSNFEEFPDEIDQCAFQEFTFIKNKVKDKNNLKAEKPLKEMGILNKKAFEDGIISLESYHKLEYLREDSSVSKKYVWMKDYLKIIFQAKNQMTPISRSYKPVSLDDEDKFSSERVRRFSKLTRRELLYKKYDENQIVLLSQILQKASRRMGVDADTESGRPYLSQEFSVLQPNGERRTYVERIDLDPQSQFNLARRLLRKDMVELQMMDMFNGLKITYEDVVMAGFETGYISIEDINYVVRYDDLWNPNITKFERVMGLVFKVAGYSTFFLPPPWNVVATIAIGIVDGIVEKRTSTGAENDNPATFIE